MNGMEPEWTLKTDMDRDDTRKADHFKVQFIQYFNNFTLVVVVHKNDTV